MGPKNAVNPSPPNPARSAKLSPQSPAEILKLFMYLGICYDGFLDILGDSLLYTGLHSVAIQQLPARLMELRCRRLRDAEH